MSAPVRGKRIAFIVFNYPLGVSTMIINSIALLARDNEVEVMVSRADAAALPLDGWLKKLLAPYPSYNRLLPVRGFKFLLQRLARWVPSSEFWWSLGNLDLLLFARWLRQRLQQRRYDILVPVEALSLIAADRAGPSGANIVYYNLELLDWAEENPLYYNKPVPKRLEHRALAGVKHVMITSPERGRIFASLNRFPAQRVSPLPVAPLARASAPRGSYFRERFGIASGRLLVLYAGNFEPWAQCVEIIRSMPAWPAHAVLVMHTWNRAALGRAYFREMQAAAAGRAVHFSAETLGYEALAPALSSADIGLLFYQDIDANFSEILFSSNKMAEYMSAGLPVVCSPFPSLKKFVEEEGIGFGTNFDEVGTAIARIAADLDGYRSRVAICAQRHFNFERSFNEAYSAYARGV
jgi:glycosyltransferase involved in cell wall biosynthesis